MNSQESSTSLSGNQYILVEVDYVSKWINEITSPINDARIMIKLFKKIGVQDL